jgi:hypothetical protein
MDWTLIAAMSLAAVGFYLYETKGKQAAPAAPPTNTVHATAPGPATAGLSRTATYVQPVQLNGNQVPGSTTSTINGAVAIANQGLGIISNLSNYTGDQSTDSSSLMDNLGGADPSGNPIGDVFGDDW